MIRRHIQRVDLYVLTLAGGSRELEGDLKGAARSWDAGDCFTNSDGPSDYRRRTILLWTNIMGRWSVVRSSGRWVLMKQAAGRPTQSVGARGRFTASGDAP